MHRGFFLTLFLFTLVILSSATYGAVDVSHYAISINNNIVDAQTKSDFDSVMGTHTLLASGRKTVIEHRRFYDNDSFDFYLVFCLVLGFGIIRYLNPRYFQYLTRAFRSPSYGNKQVKDQMESAMIPNLLMNIFFCFALGIYVTYIFKYFSPQRYDSFNPSLIVATATLGIMLLYGIKYLFMNVSGRVFNSSSIVGHYLYNVYLVNKVLAIVLLPFIIVLALVQSTLVLPVLIVSLFAATLLLISRYVRSWQVISSFFHYSKFHFFAYLCAFEILPVAVIVKFVLIEMY